MPIISIPPSHLFIEDKNIAAIVAGGLAHAEVVDYNFGDGPKFFLSESEDLTIFELSSPTTQSMTKEQWEASHQTEGDVECQPATPEEF